MAATVLRGLLASNDAHRLRAVPLFMLGDRTGFEAEVEEIARYGDELRSPYCQGLAALWGAGPARAYTVTSQHPRIWLTPQRLTDLRAGHADSPSAASSTASTMRW